MSDIFQTRLKCMFVKMRSKSSTKLGQDIPGALTWMSLSPDNSAENSLMVNLSDLARALLPIPQRSNSTRGIVLSLT